MADFPAALPNLPDPGSTLGTTGGASAHATIHTRIEEELVAVATRLGTTSEGAITGGPNVAVYGSGWLSAATVKTAGMVVTRGMLQNNTGASVTAGTPVALIMTPTHWPVGGTVSFNGSYASGVEVVRVDINVSGQLVLARDWPAAAVLSIGGFVWWV